jgi:hypothetical protein
VPAVPQVAQPTPNDKENITKSEDISQERMTFDIENELKSQKLLLVEV